MDNEADVITFVGHGWQEVSRRRSHRRHRFDERTVVVPQPAERAESARGATAIFTPGEWYVMFERTFIAVRSQASSARTSKLMRCSSAPGSLHGQGLQEDHGIVERGLHLTWDASGTLLVNGMPALTEPRCQAVIERSRMIDFPHSSDAREDSTASSQASHSPECNEAGMPSVFPTSSTSSVQEYIHVQGIATRPDAIAFQRADQFAGYAKTRLLRLVVELWHVSVAADSATPAPAEPTQSTTRCAAESDIEASETAGLSKLPPAKVLRRARRRARMREAKITSDLSSRIEELVEQTNARRLRLIVVAWKILVPASVQQGPDSARKTTRHHVQAPISPGSSDVSKEIEPEDVNVESPPMQTSRGTIGSEGPRTLACKKSRRLKEIHFDQETEMSSSSALFPSSLSSFIGQTCEEQGVESATKPSGEGKKDKEKISSFDRYMQSRLFPSSVSSVLNDLESREVSWNELNKVAVAKEQSVTNDAAYRSAPTTSKQVVPKRSLASSKKDDCDKTIGARPTAHSAFEAFQNSRELAPRGALRDNTLAASSTPASQDLGGQRDPCLKVPRASKISSAEQDAKPRSGATSGMQSLLRARAKAMLREEIRKVSRNENRDPPSLLVESKGAAPEEYIASEAAVAAVAAEKMTDEISVKLSKHAKHKLRMSARASANSTPAP